ncbi:MAG: transcriptional repressor LexA, partial [Acidobacteria bacterium]|nr:transcriptional repressor LexA [Acidobacteriota bacterium]
MALTRRQKQVLDLISGFVQSHGYSPSYEEIAEGLNLASLATVHKHISSLEAKSYLKRNFYQSRSIEISPKYLQEQRQYRQDVPALEIRLAGRIAAGAPVESVASDETLNLGDFVAGDETFALEVRGDSMIEDHICNGDYVLVERTNEVKDGEIVVALVSGSETTLKRYFRESDTMARLQPANPEMKPIMVPLENLEVQGRV